ncbi:MAG TPA: periplasmic heavy metal sensor [Reyranella sp.]|jgi:Spy/CpxP family protein refolding chaperone|nr:periplasmic heavy metal sensor [Reyranella sp.]
MSSRLIQVLLALSLLLNTFVLMGFVYRSWIEPPALERGPPPPPPGQRPSPLETMAHELNLDDGQRQALRTVFEQYSTTRRERLRGIQKVREQIAAEYKHPTVDMERVDTLIDQLTKLRAEQQKEYLGSLNQLADKLKPEQRDHLHQILAERLAMPFGQRPPGGGAGPGPGRPPQ